MTFISSFGVILGVIAIIYFSLKEINIIIAAPIATLLVIFTNQMEIVESIFGVGKNDYMGALGNYIMSFFSIYMLENRDN